ncbi:hypothetical protein PanWU01x14_106490 [Parasponia andersonii]|uniref:RNase H type-1 domain-containing protein n=1 Tax=Parasponia andersonii TaxID=3476 RepID=A0A2P5D0Q0_PARAD|nr:hypothetical protein PanWU01x14_106490 [Parasponia andersonii]
MVNTVVKGYHQVQTTPINDITHHATQISLSPGHLPQSPRQVRVYIDAAFKDREVAAAVVIRGENDQILLLVTSLFSANNPPDVELWALEVGLLHCVGRNWHCAHMFSNSEEMVLAIVDHRSSAWPLLIFPLMLFLC